MIAADLLSEIRATYNAIRAFDGVAERNQGRLPLFRRDDMPLVTARDALALVTTEAAAALGLQARTGSIRPGLQADIVLLNTRPFGMAAGDAAVHVVTQATVADVDTVIVGGELRKRGGSLVDIDLERVSRLYGEAQSNYLDGVAADGLPSLAHGMRVPRGDRRSEVRAT